MNKTKQAIKTNFVKKMKLLANIRKERLVTQ